ncbi:MAG TPA: hypothetical protein VLS88_09840 [Polyangiales bacterium]|nr:hypothetical protein [Polyangiales bacterium]
MSEPIREITSLRASSPLTPLELRMMPFKRLVALYHELPAPRFEEMHGEFAATLLDQTSASAYLRAAFAVNMKGRWLCKAFEPTGPNQGHGYNSFMTPRGVRRSVRMRTHVGRSKLLGDTNDAFHLEYADFNDFARGGFGGALVHTMFDEVRKAGPGLYLGIGRVGLTRRQQQHLYPFLMEGPVAPFQLASRD